MSMIIALHLLFAGLVGYLGWTSFKANGLWNFWTLAMTACFAWDVWTILHDLHLL